MHSRNLVTPDSRDEWVLLAAVLVLAAWARLYGLGTDSLWLDEAASWWFSSRPLVEQWRVIPHYEPHPPLYYGLLWLWSRLSGEGEAGLRGLSAFASLLTVPVVYGIGRLAIAGRDGKSVGVLAALLAALYPTQIAYAQEARAYALLTLAVGSLIGALMWLLSSPEDFARPLRQVIRDRTSGVRTAVVVVILSTAFAFWLHNTALVLVSPLLGVAALLMLLLGAHFRSLLTNCLVVGLAVLLLWLPNLSWLGSAMTEVKTGFWLQRPQWGNIAYVADNLLGSAAISSSEGWRMGITLGVLVLCAMGAAAIWRRGSPVRAVFLVSALALPFVTAIAVSLLVTPIFMPRVLVWIEVPAAVLATASLLWLPTVFLQRAVAAVLAGFLLIVLISGWGRFPKEPWRDVAQILISEAGPDDLVIAETAYAQVPLLYYGVPARFNGLWMSLPAAFPLPLGTHGYPTGFFLRDQVDARTLEQVRAAASTRKVWHVARGRTAYDPDGRLERTLKLLRGPGRIRATHGDLVLLTEYPAVRTAGQISSAAVLAPSSGAVPTPVATGQ